VIAASSAFAGELLPLEGIFTSALVALEGFDWLLEDELELQAARASVHTAARTTREPRRRLRCPSIITPPAFQVGWGTERDARVKGGLR
jgi:hypothetical protein